jgi:hypothetical protein
MIKLEKLPHTKLKIDVYSDIGFFDFNHINQYLVKYSPEEIDVTFYYRFYLRWPSLLEILKKIFLLKKSKKHVTNNIHDFKIKKVFNLPPLPKFFSFINFLLYRIQITSYADTAITFVSNPNLISYLERKYLKIFYYCLHDLTQQNVNKKVLLAEENLFKLSNKIFCDNYDVSKRIKNFNDNVKIIDPPIPDEFFNLSKKENYRYDFVYFGSFHKDIDYDFINKLSIKYSIFIISNVNPFLNNENIYFHDVIYEARELAKKVNYAKYILLPYLESEFMKTITPAKAFQVKSFDKMVLCSNKRLSTEYGFSFSNSENCLNFNFNNLRPMLFNIKNKKASIIVALIFQYINESK